MNFRLPEDSIKIVFITDKNYVVPAKTAIRSIIANKDAKTNIEINIVGVDLDFFSKLRLKNESTDKVKISILPYKIDESKFPKNSTCSTHVTSADYAKFDLTKIFPDYDKILYLDADVVVLDDLSELYNMELGDNYMAAVEDLVVCAIYTKEDLPRYINNGVMLLNLNQMRIDDVSSKLYKQKTEDSENRFVTQDTFNYVMKDKIKFLPVKYNTFALMYDNIDKANKGFIFSLDYEHCNFSLYDELLENMDKMVILHYANKSKYKPWNNSPSVKDSYKFWYKYVPIDFVIRREIWNLFKNVGRRKRDKQNV